jgi:Helix-turn-helix domain
MRREKRLQEYKLARRDTDVTPKEETAEPIVQRPELRRRQRTRRSSSSSPRLVRTSEAARYLALSPWSLRRLVQTGALPIVSSCDVCNWRFDVRDLDAWVERNKRIGEEVS